jgi:hypothetical protein
MKTCAMPMEAERKGAPHAIAWTVPCRGAMEAQMELVKERFLAPIVKSGASSALVKEIAWAAHEAVALAWYTACPILVLPVLLEEKAMSALKRWQKQELLRRLPTRCWRLTASGNLFAEQTARNEAGLPFLQTGAPQA